MDWPQWIHQLKWSCRVWTQRSGRIEPLRSYVKGWGWQWGWRSFTGWLTPACSSRGQAAQKKQPPVFPFPCLGHGLLSFELWLVWDSIGFFCFHFVYNGLHCEELQNRLCLWFLSVFLHSDTTITPSSENPQSLLHEFQLFSFKHNDFFFPLKNVVWSMSVYIRDGSVCAEWECVCKCIYKPSFLQLILKLFDDSNKATGISHLKT